MLADHCSYFNDDTTVLRTLTPADLFTPLYGPVLRFQPDLLVNPVDPATSNTDREGEVRQRFGLRR